MKIAIIGGGISGLSAAYYLTKNAAPKAHNITVYEKEKRPGGTIGTIKEDGFTAETGPNGYLDSKPYITELAAALNIQGSLLKADAASAARYIFDGKKLHKLPENPGAFIKSGLISIAGKLRIIAEPLVVPKKSSEDESVASFTRRRLGREALDKLVTPMVSGIFAGDPEKLSLKSAFPRMFELEREYGSLFKAMAKLGRGGAPPGKLTSFDNGMGVIIEALSKNLGRNIKTGFSVDSVKRIGGSWSLSGSGFMSSHDAVVFAVPSYELAGMFEPARAAAGRIDYAPLSVVHLGFEQKDIEKKAAGFGFLTAGKVKNAALGAVFASIIFRNRAPEGKGLITVMAGGDKNREVYALTDADLLKAVLDGLKRATGISAAPVFTKIIRHEKAIPIYRVGHEDIVAELLKIFSGFPGLYLGGNAFFGISASDMVKRSAAVAAEINSIR
jgi:oxygen-dependent protoporphyrinogen oxidase